MVCHEIFMVDGGRPVTANQAGVNPVNGNYGDGASGLWISTSVLLRPLFCIPKVQIRENREHLS